MSIMEINSWLRPDQEWIGADELERINRVIKLYERYEGQQVWRYYKKPGGLEYDPTLLTVNHDRLLIDTMAAWEFEMEPKWEVEPQVIDDPIDMVKPGYKQSDEQERENKRAAAKERLINRVHKDNRTHEKLLEAAKDRKIAGTVWAKLFYDKRLGRIRLSFRPDFEVISKYNHDDEELLEEVHFHHYLDDESRILWKQSFTLEWDEEKYDYECWLHEAVYEIDENNDIWLKDTKVEKSKMGLNFIPVVEIPNERLTGMDRGFSEIEKWSELTDEINKKLSDYSDAIRFEMFAITLLMGVDNDKGLKVAPGAMWNLQGDGGLLEGERPDAKKLESNFKFKDATESYLDRMYSNLYKIAEVPSVNTAEMKTGGVNDQAVKLMHRTIISKTQRSWVVWKSRLQLLNEYILRYMEARVDDPRFSYDRKLVEQMDDDRYDNVVHLRLPLPEDQNELVERLTSEMSADLESIKGALARKGVENPEAKLMEILAEEKLMKQEEDPYNERGSVLENNEE
ncbi:Phage portal protein, SPP1 Gp6-like [Oceanobacillus limi]|uniref:Phage portal protein, SPP1 Gp6-like n=1 Tax=Oceanobacillus limi TaxID=930131 RepID=A0A1I0GDU9_9BACI|nr:phage portal protein [Oceanobacillus limi]SET69037.1 Phage portal protein, SPP1 Gp6-like [Oceanobacillus limi]